MSDSKKVWKGIRQLVNLKSRSATRLLVEDVELNDPKSMADAFHNFFANIGNNLTKNTPRVNKSHVQYLRVHLKIFSFYFSQQQLKLKMKLLG